MKKTIISILAVAGLGSALAGCVVEPVDGVSVGAGHGVILQLGGDAPGSVTLDGRPVVQQTPVIVQQPTVVQQPTPVIIEHQRPQHEHWRDYDHDE